MLRTLLMRLAYSEILVDRHPSALGQRLEAAQPEAWPTLGLASVLSTGHGSAADRLQPMPEEG